jgi:hypothetical protein
MYAAAVAAAAAFALFPAVETLEEVAGAVFVGESKPRANIKKTSKAPTTSNMSASTMAFRAGVRNTTM